jgi:hypothetical protein
MFGWLTLFLPLKFFMFYLGMGVIVWFLFVGLNGKKLYSLMLSLGVIFVSSEFWEIPVFVRGYLGTPGYLFPCWPHHLMIIVMAVLLFGLANIKFTKWKVGVLCLPPLLTYMLMLLEVDNVVYFLARSYAIFTLTILILAEEPENEHGG